MAINHRRALIGKAKIKFENKDNLVYPYCTYRKSDTKLALYNVVFTYTNAREVAKNLSMTYHRDKVLPNFKILDERNKTIFDSKFDKLEDFMDS